MTLAEYFKACEYHDWFYAMTDDSRVYHRGADREAGLLHQAQTDSDKQAIYDAWKIYHSSGPGWVHKIKQPRPRFENNRLVVEYTDAEKLQSIVLTVASGGPVKDLFVRGGVLAPKVDLVNKSEAVEIDGCPF